MNRRGPLLLEHAGSAANPPVGEREQNLLSPQNARSLDSEERVDFLLPRSMDQPNGLPPRRNSVHEGDSGDVEPIATSFESNTPHRSDPSRSEIPPHRTTGRVYQDPTQPPAHPRTTNSIFNLAEVPALLMSAHGSAWDLSPSLPRRRQSTSSIDSAPPSDPAGRSGGAGTADTQTQSLDASSADVNDADFENYLLLMDISEDDFGPFPDTYDGPSVARPGIMKRSRDNFEIMEGKETTKALTQRGAIAIILYENGTPNPEANDVWPHFRTSAKSPAQYYILTKGQAAFESQAKWCSTQALKANMVNLKREGTLEEESLNVPAGRSKWQLPVEIVELIASHLSRDDIKSMRLVSHELNYCVSQVIFRTVVVPFNTEIYGMLGSEQKPSSKGKRKVKIENPGYSWNNSSGDDVYNGHGLDVFRGFGKHILRFGMSFEVDEDSLANPPEKSLTEHHTSFWGSYDWPFEEYRRFDIVAGLESAADETPRMKTAFSELSKVQELGLSVDSGLGWLNGPDKSIRTRILQRPPEVFGTVMGIPDRRAQAQKDLWDYVENCHRYSESDIRLANLYRWEAPRPLLEPHEDIMIGERQPELPYLESHVIHQAIPHDTVDIPVPENFDDPEVRDRFVIPHSALRGGLLYSSSQYPSEAAQLMSSIIPASLTEAQTEWLLETEWAQRAFLSSYMLSIMDNPITFAPVTTLNISRMSDRYVSMLNRADFWDALPHVSNVTLMVIPGFRTVYKDEAGFVITTKISPLSSINSFRGLLQSIANRRNVRCLTTGWATGGEHAAGLHARNKLLLPAPLLPEDMVTEQGRNELYESLLHFPYVEHLCLKNCWVTPSALLHFVQIHDSFSLKHIVLNSVSLTAILRPLSDGVQTVQPVIVNGNQAPLPTIGAVLAVNALWNALNNTNANGQAFAQGQMQINAINLRQLVVFHIQALMTHLQQLQGQVTGQLQAQVSTLCQQLHHFQQRTIINMSTPLQFGTHRPHDELQQLVTLANQVQHLQHLATAAAPSQLPVPSFSETEDASPPEALLIRPREGSWLNIIDIISPGRNLAVFGNLYSQSDPNRTTSLQVVELISCGYARFPYTSFDQSAIEPRNGFGSARTPIFSNRCNALVPAMLNARWPNVGEIVQEIDLGELAALNAGWDIVTGWKDEEEARAVEFDGLLPGGTGRISGVVR